MENRFPKMHTPPSTCPLPKSSEVEENVLEVATRGSLRTFFLFALRNLTVNGGDLVFSELKLISKFLCVFRHVLRRRETKTAGAFWHQVRLC